VRPCSDVSSAAARRCAGTGLVIVLAGGGAFGFRIWSPSSVPSRWCLAYSPVAAVVSAADILVHLCSQERRPGWSNRCVRCGIGMKMRGGLLSAKARLQQLVAARTVHADKPEMGPPPMALFVLIGAHPRTNWLPRRSQRDARRFSCSPAGSSRTAATGRRSACRSPARDQHARRASQPEDVRHLFRSSASRPAVGRGLHRHAARPGPSSPTRSQASADCREERGGSKRLSHPA